MFRRTELWHSLKSRCLETVSSRIRFGHARVKTHLHRFEMSDTDDGEFCNQPDMIEHFLMSCRKFTNYRREMEDML